MRIQLKYERILGNIECVNFNYEMNLLLINASYKMFREEFIVPTGIK
jgi:hypothetical protein